MVAAKLDQSRVLVTKFRQNRLTLKGRSAGQRHTDRQTRLKIMALQVCNRARNSQSPSMVSQLELHMSNTAAANIFDTLPPPVNNIM